MDNSYGIVVKDNTDIDYEGARELNELNYNTDLAAKKVNERKDIEYGYIFNWVQYFADLGGFDAVLNVLSMGMDDEKAVKAPFALVSYISKPFKNLNNTFSEEFAKLFA